MCQIFKNHAAWSMRHGPCRKKPFWCKFLISVKIIIVISICTLIILKFENLKNNFRNLVQTGGYADKKLLNQSYQYVETTNFSDFKFFFSKK